MKSAGISSWDKKIDFRRLNVIAIAANATKKRGRKWIKRENVDSDVRMRVGDVNKTESINIHQRLPNKDMRTPFIYQKIIILLLLFLTSEYHYEYKTK